MNQVLFEVNIPDYITHVKLSEHRRAKHYRKGDKIPLKYMPNKGYSFNKKDILVDNLGNPVIKNIRVAGTPSWKKINGQEFYKGSTNPVVRSKMVATMKDFFRPYFNDIKPLSPEQMPITVELEIHDNPLDEFDIDNLGWIYTKVILDILTEKKIIPDDSVNYVAKSGGCQFVRTAPDELRQLTVIISKNNYTAWN